MKMYQYLVSYTFEKDGYLTWCTGSAQVYRKYKIKNFDDLNEIVSCLTKDIEGARNLSISNFILLGRYRKDN